MLSTFRISGSNFYLQEEGGNRILNKNIEFLNHFVKHISIIHGESERSWACNGLPSGSQKRNSEEWTFPRMHISHRLTNESLRQTLLETKEYDWYTYIYRSPSTLWTIPQSLWIILPRQHEYEIVNSKIISEFNQWIKISSSTEEKVIRKEIRRRRVINRERKLRGKKKRKRTMGRRGLLSILKYPWKQDNQERKSRKKEKIWW